jgi:hypothetical protein
MTKDSKPTEREAAIRKYSPGSKPLTMFHSPLPDIPYDYGTLYLDQEAIELLDAFGKTLDVLGIIDLANKIHELYVSQKEKK